MRQASIEEFMRPPRPKCPACGREFKDARGLNVHLSRMHPGYVPDRWPDEGLEVEERGGHVVVKIRVRRDFWRDIARRASEERASVEDLVFSALANLAAFGRCWQLWALEESPSYIV